MDVNLDFSEGEGARINSIGRCIYCGDDNLELTDEHIVPRSLTGNSIIFEKASCEDCRVKISRFEGPCLQYVLGPIRQKLNSPRRRRGSKREPLPTHHSLSYQRVTPDQKPVGPVETIQIPVSKAPIIVPGWICPPPGMLAGRESSTEITGRPYASWNKNDLAQCGKFIHDATGYSGAARILETPVDPVLFMRFIAKIAHGFHVAINGYSETHKLLVPIILGQAQNYFDLVGMSPDPRPPAHKTSIAHVRDGKSFSLSHPTTIFYIVSVRLFPLFNGPEYHAVVGRRDCSPEEFALAKNPTDERMEQLLVPDRSEVPGNIRFVGGR